MNTIGSMIMIWYDDLSIDCAGCKLINDKMRKKWRMSTIETNPTCVGCQQGFQARASLNCQPSLCWDHYQPLSSVKALLSAIPVLRKSTIAIKNYYEPLSIIIDHSVTHPWKHHSRPTSPIAKPRPAMGITSWWGFVANGIWTFTHFSLVACLDM